MTPFDLFGLLFAVFVLGMIAGHSLRRDRASSGVGVLALAAALALPPPVTSDEPATDRAARVQIIGEAVGAEAETPPPGWPWSAEDLALAALTKMWAESGRFDPDVHAGTRRGDRGRSICLGQIMIGGPWTQSRADWLGLAGTDAEATRRCARVVMLALAFHAKRCRVGGPAVPWKLAKVMAGYGSGWSCSATIADEHGVRWAERRSWMWWRLRQRFAAT